MKFDPFTRFYGLNFRTVSAVDVVLKYQALEQGAFDAMIVYTTDGLNKRAGLTILADDKGFFPEYNGGHSGAGGPVQPPPDRHTGAGAGAQPAHRPGQQRRTWWR